MARESEGRELGVNRAELKRNVCPGNSGTPASAKPGTSDNQGPAVALSFSRTAFFLTDDHIERIVKVYKQFKDEPGFTRIATLEEVRAKDGNLRIPLHVGPVAHGGSDSESTGTGKPELGSATGAWMKSSGDVSRALDMILEGRP